MIVLDEKVVGESINALDFFKDFSEETRTVFTKICQVRQYEDGEWVIEEGDLNETPYILIEGSVNILKGENVVETITEHGSFIGEISFASKENISCAKVIADGEVKLLSFNSKELREVLGMNNPSLKLSCLMKFAHNNIHKIDETNVKIASLMEQKLSLDNDS
ncbi:MAG: cyclic nucleotide-binding domain-containing protein [Nitrospinae bacterium]|nr:cyclic nucleotide-binding domain-containing protein [Nitrospinota bacterium]